MRRAPVLAAALVAWACDREPNRPLPAESTRASAPSAALSEPVPPAPAPVVLQRDVACRALRVRGEARTEDGAALVERAVLDGGTWLTLSNEARVVVVHARSGREVTLVGPGRFLPCRGGTEQFLVAEGTLEGAAGTGVRPGAEVWIATPFGTLRYGDAALTAEVQEKDLRVTIERGALAAELAPGVQGFPAKGLTGPNGRAVLTSAPDAAGLVAACETAAREAHESAARVLAARSGPPRGSEAGKHLVLRRRARSLCASAAASVARVADPAARSRLGDQLDRADGLWQTIARAPVPDPSGSAR